MLRYRQGWFGKMILQVRDWEWGSSPGIRDYYWRDARLADFISQPDGTLKLAPRFL